MLFGEHLRAERVKRNLSAKALACKCGTSRSYITLIESGKRLPGKKIIPNIAIVLNLKPSIVINWYLEDMREKLEEKMVPPIQ
jgi:transcriptional regulator with XRE-family HTH domain